MAVYKHSHIVRNLIVVDLVLIILACAILASAQYVNASIRPSKSQVAALASTASVGLGTRSDAVNLSAQAAQVDPVGKPDGVIATNEEKPSAGPSLWLAFVGTLAISAGMPIAWNQVKR